MNVIKFEIEILISNNIFKRFINKIFYKKKLNPISGYINENFKNEIECDGDFVSKLHNEWNSLFFENITTLNSPKYLLGYTTTKNIKIFVFEKQNSGLRNKSNIAVDVISFGELDVEVVFNESIKKIQSILRPLSCKHINNSQIFIFPYNSQNKDIYSYELKVKAIVKSIKLSNFEGYSWGIMFLISFLSIVIYFLTENPDTKNICLVLMGSGITLFAEIFIYIIKKIAGHFKKNVYIQNMSSVVDTIDISTLTKEEELKIPGEND